MMMKKILTILVLAFLGGMNADGQTAYITNYTDNTVSVFNVVNYYTTTTIHVGNGPFGVSVSPDGTKVYVGNYNDNTVSVINTATHSVSATITVGAQPEGICISPDGSKVYVANHGTTTVSVINTTTNTVSATITVGASPRGICVSPDGSKVYVANYGTVSISVINTVTDTVLTTIPLGAYPPWGIAISPDGTKLYVTTNDNKVKVLNSATNTVSAVIPVGSLPFGICVSHDGNKVYVANYMDGTVSVINSAIDTVLATVYVGYSGVGCWGVSMSLDGTKVYVAVEAANEVWGINTTTNIASNTFQVGIYPRAFGNFISTYPCTAFTPVITPSGPTILNPGDTVNLDAGSFSSYLWSTGATTEILRVFAAGTYTVTATNSFGCTGTAQRPVTMNTVPTHQDCRDAIPICTNVYVENNTYTGVGNYINEINSGMACGMTEYNSSWYIVTCQDAGQFGFLLTPTDPSANFDWAVFNQSGTFTCSNFYTNGALTVACNSDPTPGATGMCGGVGPQFGMMINAAAGQTFVICINNISGNVGGFTLDFNCSTVPIADNVPPYMASITSPIACNATTIKVHFSEEVQCSTVTISPVTFYVTDLINVVHSVTAIASTNCTIGAPYDNYYTLTISPALSIAGTYQLHINGGLVEDLCGNVAAAGSLNFNIAGVIIHPHFTDAICNSGGMAWTTISIGPGPFTYSWSPTSATTDTISNLSPGNYTCTVNGSSGCPGITIVTINSSYTAPPTPGPITGSTSVCQGNQQTYSVVPVLGATSYTWSLPSGWTGNSLSDSITTTVSSSGGTISVTANDSCGSSLAQTLLVISGSLNLTITPNCPTTFCQGDSVLLDAGTYSSYHWSTGATIQSITVSTTGTYRVTVTNSNGCTGTATQAVNVYSIPNPTIIPNGPTTFCHGGSVTLDAVNYSSYLWNTGETTETIFASATNVYRVTVTNSNGCTASASEIVNVFISPAPIITANGPTTFCQGGSLQLNAGTFSLYQWSTGETSQAIIVNASGNYQVTVTDLNACTGTGSQAVTVNPSPNPTIVPNGPTTFCQGGSVTLDAGNYSSYLWNNGATTETIIATTSNTYLVTVTSINGCTATASQVVTVNISPTPTIMGNGSICNGNSTTLDAGVYASYNWNTGASTQTISTSTAGNFVVTVTDNNGCSGTASRVVVVNSNPTPSVTLNGPTTFCNGGNVVLDAGSYASFIWNNGATTETISASISGIFMVTVSDNNGCTGIASQAVTVNSNPIPTIIPNGPITFCEGDSVSLDAGSWVSYSWNTGNTSESITVFGSQPYCVTVTSANGCTGNACQFVAVFAHPTPVIIPNGPTTFCTGGSVTLNAGIYANYLWNNGATTATITTGTTGIYTVTVSNANNCSASASISIHVNAGPAPVISANGPTSFCQGGMVTLDAGIYAAYHWMNSLITETMLVLSSGNFTVTVTGNNGCTGIATQVVTVIPFINPIISASGPTQFCSGGSVTLDAGSYNNYSWNNGSTMESIIAATSGTYIVTVSNGGNCSGTAQRIISAYSSPVPNILITGLSNLCGGGMAALKVGATFPSYLWSNGATTQVDSINSGGIYSVSVTNANGCTGSASATITSTCAIPIIAATPTTNIGSTYAMANWIQPSCHVGYNIRISVHNANVWIVHTIPLNNHYTFSGLAHNTTYDWQVQTNCNASLTIVSGYSASQTFTTLARLEGTEEASVNASFNIYPNPTCNQATIVFSSEKEETYTIRFIDITGREVLSVNNTSVIGDNQYQMNLSEIVKGIYVVVLQNSNGTLQKKIIIE